MGDILNCWNSGMYILQLAEEDETMRSLAAMEKSGQRIDRITSDILTLGALFGRAAHSSYGF